MGDGPQAQSTLRVKQYLRRFGLLPFTDATAPSLVAIVARAPVSGSWWGHPAGQAIYQVGETLDSDPDVLAVRLWRGKVTLVHRRLWPALLRVGRARAVWQMAGLTEVARGLLDLIERESLLRSDRLPEDFQAGYLGFRPALRDLEQRLLVLTRSVHTRSGAHALEAESWSSWRSKTGTVSYAGSVASARLLLEQAAQGLTPGVESRRSLPWGRYYESTRRSSRLRSA
ncbi:MAG: hypothetical protein L3K14_04540 [Thermoplasmata archaeon]|nr:hypothetical protein [Thermoplasmata archaeon]